LCFTNRYNIDGDITNGSVAYIVNDLNGDGVVGLINLHTIDDNLTNGAAIITF
jgi:hypothetical protein